MAESYDIHLTDPLAPAFKVRAFTTNGANFPTSTSFFGTESVGADTSLLVYGKGVPNYGERIAENILHVLENFSGATVPQFPVSGQLWYARYTLLKVGAAYYEWVDDSENVNGGSWNEIFPTENAAPPDDGNGVPGDYWYSTYNSTMHYKVGDAHPLGSVSGVWILRIHDNVPGLGVPPDPAAHKPRKVLKVYNGNAWVDSTTVYASESIGEPPTPVEGDLWFDTTSNQLKIFTNGSFLSVTNDYLLLTGGIMSGSVNMGTNSITGLANFVGGESDNYATNKKYVDDEIITAISGINIPTILEDLDNVNALPLLDTFMKANGSTWENVTLTLTDIVDVIDTTGAEVSFLGGVTPVTSSVQGQLNSKINLSGATLNPAAQLFIDPPSVNLTPVFNELVTKNYIDTVVGAIIDDGVLTSAVFTPATMDLQLDTSAPSTVNVDIAHTHDSAEISHTTTQPLLRDLLASYPTVQLDETTESIISNLNQRLAHYETFAAREIFVAVAAQTDFVFTEGTYTVGTNRLHVYVDGVKQYADERAHQSILFDPSKNLSASSLHGLPDASYELDIAIDGGAPLTITIVVVNGTSTNVTIQEIINEIGGSSSTIPVWGRRDTAIHVFSNIAGTTSEINITDGLTNGLLAALAAVGTTAELPIYLVGNVSPPSGGPITQITDNQDYKEMNDDLLSQGTFKTTSHTIQFGAGFVGGEIVEMISEPAFFNM